MVLQIIDLPPEILYHILSFLDIHELSTLRTVQSGFRQLINDSQTIQFRVTATTGGVESNRHTSHAASERLSLLRNRENGWFTMNIDFSKSITNIKWPSGIYDLTGGIYFKGDMLRKSIHYCRLPSNPSDDVSWRKIQIDKGRLVDIGVSVLEHDLIAILTYSDHPTIPRGSRIELSLIQLSTGRQHPLARNPVLVVSEGEMFQPAILLEIVGEFVVLIMTHHVGGPRPPDSIHVFEWKTGTLKMHITRPCFTYHDFIFLSPTIILLPNYHLNTLDAWELPTGTTPAPTEPFLSLALPGLSLGSFIINGSCRCEPNPAPSGIKHSNAPFSANPTNAIVVLNMRIHGPDGGSAYSIYVHRGSLLQVCTTVRPEDEDGVSHFLPSTFTVERVPGKRVRAWADWGPPICRAFDASTATLRWITTTAGQRAIVNLADNDEDEEDYHPSLLLLDFNPFNVLRLVRAWCSDTGEFPDHEVDLDNTEITVSGVQEPIRSRLPYISVKIPFPEDWRERFEGLLLDEERILVLLYMTQGTNDSDDDEDVDDVEEQIEVLHIGGSADVDTSHFATIADPFPLIGRDQRIGPDFIPLERGDLRPY